ncbi:hypothetical protein H0H92_010133, partial [Tricholoma furcatifolium]
LVLNTTVITTPCSPGPRVETPAAIEFSDDDDSDGADTSLLVPRVETPAAIELSDVSDGGRGPKEVQAEDEADKGIWKAGRRNLFFMYYYTVSQIMSSSNGLPMGYPYPFDPYPWETATRTRNKG